MKRKILVTILSMLLLVLILPCCARVSAKGKNKDNSEKVNDTEEEEAVTESEAAEESVPPAGLLGQEGLEAMVELYDTGRTMHRCGRLSAASCLAGAVIGAALAVAPCWSGNWAAVSAARVLLYMLAWLIPGFACRALLKK